MKAKKITWNEYQERVEQVKKAVLDDLNTLNSSTSILKVRTHCRDEEDYFSLLCMYDFSPYIDGLFKRFNPDVKNFIEFEYESLKKWYNQSNYRDAELKKYCSEIYSKEQIYKKYYITVTKYVEIKNQMTILYSADFSLKGEVLSIDDPTGYYSGFDYSKDGYSLSEAEQIISDNMDIFWKSDIMTKQLPYQKGDIVYVDGSPYVRPFYGVCCGEQFLHIFNIEHVNILEKYPLSKRGFAFPRIFLTYSSVQPFFKVQVLDSCEYQCLTAASNLLKKENPTETDVKTAIQDIFEEEFKNKNSLPQSGSRMIEIFKEFSKISEKYSNMSFTEILNKFRVWLRTTKTIRFNDLDDESFLQMFSDYCKDDLNKQDKQIRKFVELRKPSIYDFF